MSDSKPLLFFGTGTGRCGTMTLVNLLNSENHVACLHEGKFRHREVSGEQWLPFLTFENILAYQDPGQAEEIFLQKRGNLLKIATEHNLIAFGDIAYNYASFVHIINKQYPIAKLLVIVRDGRDFVRSAYSAEVPDPTPVGWVDEREFSKLERFIALGRLRPHDSEDPNSRWHSMDPIARNAWLWSETNRLIFEGLKQWSVGTTMIIRFEEFFAAPISGYAKVRDFLGLCGSMPMNVREILATPINRRVKSNLPHWSKWSREIMDTFLCEAEEMMRFLNYLH